MSENNTPSYIANAKPNSASNRAAWFKNTAPAYAGILLWFVFWTMVKSDSLVHGLAMPIIAVIVGALVCHFFFYLTAGLFGCCVRLWAVRFSAKRAALLCPGF